MRCSSSWMWNLMNFELAENFLLLCWDQKKKGKKKKLTHNEHIIKALSCSLKILGIGKNTSRKQMWHTVSGLCVITKSEIHDIVLWTIKFVRYSVSHKLKCCFCLVYPDCYQYQFVIKLDDISGYFMEGKSGPITSKCERK